MILSTKKRFIMLVTILLILAAIFTVKNIFIDTYFEFEFSSDLCTTLFGCSAEDFKTADLEISKEVFDLQKKSKMCYTTV